VAAFTSIAGKLGMTPETLRVWVRRAQVDDGVRPGLTTDERQKLKDLEKEVKELRRANETEGRLDFLRDRARRSTEEVVHYIDSRKNRWGVEPICTTLQFASRTYYAAKRRPRCARKVRDEALKPQIARVHKDNFDVYGADKVWTQMNREGHQVARCTVERLMRDLHLGRARRGKVFKRTTVADDLEQSSALIVGVSNAYPFAHLTSSFAEANSARRSGQSGGRPPPTLPDARHFAESHFSADARISTRSSPRWIEAKLPAH
jgi:hypothetical protein